MPTTFEGNINGTVTSPQYNLPFVIPFFQIANKNAGTTIINVTIQTGSQNLCIVPQDLTLSQGDYVEGCIDERVIQAASQIKVASNGSVDFYFTLKNTKPDDDNLGT